MPSIRSIRIRLRNCLSSFNSTFQRNPGQDTGVGRRFAYDQGGDYSDKSYAIFTTDRTSSKPSGGSEGEKKSPLLFGRGLTGPGLGRCQDMCSPKSKKRMKSSQC